MSRRRSCSLSLATWPLLYRLPAATNMRMFTAKTSTGTAICSCWPCFASLPVVVSHLPMSYQYVISRRTFSSSPLIRRTQRQTPTTIVNTTNEGGGGGGDVCTKDLEDDSWLRLVGVEGKHATLAVEGTTTVSSEEPKGVGRGDVDPKAEADGDGSDEFEEEEQQAPQQQSAEEKINVRAEAVSDVFRLRTVNGLEWIDVQGTLAHLRTTKKPQQQPPAAEEKGTGTGTSAATSRPRRLAFSYSDIYELRPGFINKGRKRKEGKEGGEGGTGIPTPKYHRRLPFMMQYDPFPSVARMMVDPQAIEDMKARLFRPHSDLAFMACVAPLLRADGVHERLIKDAVRRILLPQCRVLLSSPQDETDTGGSPQSELPGGTAEESRGDATQQLGGAEQRKQRKKAKACLLVCRFPLPRFAQLPGVAGNVPPQSPSGGGRYEELLYETVVADEMLSLQKEEEESDTTTTIQQGTAAQPHAGTSSTTKNTTADRSPSSFPRWGGTSWASRARAFLFPRRQKRAGTVGRRRNPGGGIGDESVVKLTTRLTVFVLPEDGKIITCHRAPIGIISRMRANWHTENYCRTPSLLQLVNLMVKGCVESYLSAAAQHTLWLDQLESTLFPTTALHFDDMSGLQAQSWRSAIAPSPFPAQRSTGEVIAAEGTIGSVASLVRRLLNTGSARLRLSVQRQTVESIYNINRRASVFCRLLQPLPFVYSQFVTAATGTNITLSLALVLLGINPLSALSLGGGSGPASPLLSQGNLLTTPAPNNEERCPQDRQRVGRQPDRKKKEEKQQGQGVTPTSSAAAVPPPTSRRRGRGELPESFLAQDVAHHCKNALTMCEELRDSSQSLLTLHFQMTSNELEELVRVITVVSSIFIPLSFICSMFGMEFKSWAPFYHSDKSIFVSLVLLMTATFSTWFWVWWRFM